MSIALTFPGQGSQSVGMLGELAAAEPDIRQTFDQASDALGYDLWRVCSEDPDQTLASTEVTQPALLTASVALWRLWQARGGEAPTIMAGHSLGEYSALTCAGALAFDDALTLVRERGRLMQGAVPAGVGAMAAIIGLDDDVVIAACKAVAGGQVTAANFNAPGQVVIAGESKAVDMAIEHCNEAGARRALPLAVSVPSHSPLMSAMRAPFSEALAALSVTAPTIPVVNNVDVVVTSDPDEIRDALIRQLDHSVQWSACVRKMVAAGATDFVECGPGKVLGGLLRRIHKPANAHSIDTPDGLQKALAALTV
ncbi:MAG: ACP S-malonyltransferase [Pseudomonadota bacterium]